MTRDDVLLTIDNQLDYVIYHSDKNSRIRTRVNIMKYVDAYIEQEVEKKMREQAENQGDD